MEKRGEETMVNEVVMVRRGRYARGRYITTSANAYPFRWDLRDEMIVFFATFGAVWWGERTDMGNEADSSDLTWVAGISPAQGQVLSSRGER